MTPLRSYAVQGNVITLHGVGPRHVVPDPLGLALERLEAEVIREVHEEPSRFLERARRARRRDRLFDLALCAGAATGIGLAALLVMAALAGSSR